MPSWRTRAAALLGAAASGMDRVSDKLGDARRTAGFLAGRLQFRPRPDDIYVATYPRSGTTWMQFMLHLLVGDGDTQFDHIGQVSPWFERSLAIGSMQAADFEPLPSPRILKTHLVPRWLPSPGRFLWIQRSVLDVAVSYHAFYRSHLGFEGTEREFLDAFMSGRLQYGSWHDHTARWQSPRAGQRVLRLRYEDLVDDTDGALQEVATFLDLSVPRDRIREVVEAASFDAMKKLESKFDHTTAVLLERGMAPGGFIRSGPGRTKTAPAGWAEALSEARTSRRGPINLPLFLH